MNRKSILIALVILQMVIIGAMLLKAMLPLLTGQEIELRVTPRDPREIFRGNYVDLNYEFNRVNMDSMPNDLPPGAAFHYGDVLFVELKKSGQFYEPAGVWVSPPRGGAPFLKTIVEYPFYNQEGQYHFLHIQGGIESYFTDPQTAKEIEEKLRDQVIEEKAPLISVTIMVTSSGQARIKRISYEGVE